MTFNPIFIKILSYKNQLFSEISMTHDYPINYIFHVYMDFYHLQYIHYYNPWLSQMLNTVEITWEPALRHSELGQEPGDGTLCGG